MDVSYGSWESTGKGTASQELEKYRLYNIMVYGKLYNFELNCDRLNEKGMDNYVYNISTIYISYLLISDTILVPILFVFVVTSFNIHWHF